MNARGGNAAVLGRLAGMLPTTVAGRGTKTRFSGHIRRPSLSAGFGVVPPFYLIRAANGSVVVAGDAFFTAKEARCFPETAFGFVGLPLATLSTRRKCRRVHGDPGGVFIATREPSYGTQRCSGREPLVPMMEPADLWKRHDLSAAAGLNRSLLGGVLAQRKMGSGSVVIIQVQNKDPSQMPFIQDDHVVQAFAPHAADQAFHIWILTRASWRRDDLFHAHRHHRRAERLPVCAVAVADQIPRRRVPWKGFA